MLKFKSPVLKLVFFCLLIFINLKGFSQQIFSIANKKGYINPLGDTVYNANLYPIWMDTEKPRRYYNNLNQGWGLINMSGAGIIEPKYTSLVRESGFYIAAIQNTFGLLDKNGKIRIPFIYENGVNYLITLKNIGW